MDRTIKDFQKIMSAQFPERNQHQKDKGQSLFELAYSVSIFGNIVELGTYRGMGTSALCLGARHSVKIYRVDDFETRIGWAGEHYDYGNYAYYQRNIQALGLETTLIKGSVEYARGMLNIPINLVFYDLGLPGVVSIFEMWQDAIVNGGMFAVHDTKDGRLGAHDLEQNILEDKYPGWKFYDNLAGDITVFINGE